MANFSNEKFNAFAKGFMDGFGTVGQALEPMAGTPFTPQDTKKPVFLRHSRLSKRRASFYRKSADGQLVRWRKP